MGNFNSFTFIFEMKTKNAVVNNVLDKKKYYFLSQRLYTVQKTNTINKL